MPANTASGHNGSGNNKNRMQLQTGSRNASKTPSLAAEEVNGNPGNQAAAPPPLRSSHFGQTHTPTPTCGLMQVLCRKQAKLQTSDSQTQTHVRSWGRSGSDRPVPTRCLCSVYIAHNLSPFARWMLLWAGGHYKAIHAYWRNTDTRRDTHSRRSRYYRSNTLQRPFNNSGRSLAQKF